uniref:Uncharacterized protein n=1 Tax=Panthera leo TaxID=9689 RepID=A0A8C8WRP5_PANLE
MRSIWASAEVYCIFPAGFMLLNALLFILFHSLPSVGMKFLEDCPIQTLIPLYLLVGGIIGALKVSLLLHDSTRMRWPVDDDAYPWRQTVCKYHIHLSLSLSLFLFLWFLLGNYRALSVYLPDFIPPFQQPQDYCDKTLYPRAVGSPRAQPHHAGPAHPLQWACLCVVQVEIRWDEAREAKTGRLFPATGNSNDHHKSKFCGCYCCYYCVVIQPQAT